MVAALQAKIDQGGADIADLFGRYHFAHLQPSSVLTDLGPLFG